MLRMISIARVGSCLSTRTSAPASTSRAPWRTTSATAITRRLINLASRSAVRPVFEDASQSALANIQVQGDSPPQIANQSPAFGRSVSSIPLNASSWTSLGTSSRSTSFSILRRSGPVGPLVTLAKLKPRETPTANAALTNATPSAAPSCTDKLEGSLATLKSVVTRYSW